MLKRLVLRRRRARSKNDAAQINSVYTPRSGRFWSASLNRLVKFAAQITSVSSTICPSS